MAYWVDEDELGLSSPYIKKLVEEFGFPRGKIIGKKRRRSRTELDQWYAALPEDKRELVGCCKLQAEGARFGRAKKGGAK
jgi:hypothetical protein